MKRMTGWLFAALIAVPLQAQEVQRVAGNSVAVFNSAFPVFSSMAS